jgi:hypothetical protein
MGAGLTAALAGVTAAAAAMGAAIRESAKIETTETGIKTLVKDAGLAKAIVQDLKRAAADTPLELGDLASGARGLLAGGTAVKDLKSELMVLGDVATGAQTDLGGIVSVFNQVRQKGKLTTEELLQLKERGVAGLNEELSKISGIPVERLGDAITAGKVSADDLKQAFVNLTSTGGLYFGAMKDQSQTLTGKLSTLSDAFKELMRVPGDAGLGPAKRLVDTLTGGVQEATRFATVFVKTLELAGNNGRIGEFVGLSVNLGLRKAWEGFLGYVTNAGGGIRQAIAEEVGNGLAIAYNSVAGLLGRELMPVDKDSGVKAFIEAGKKETAQLENEFNSFMQGGRLAVEQGLKETAEKMKEAMAAGGKEVKAGAADLKSAAGDLKAAKTTLAGDADGDGIISKREKRRADIDGRRAERKANSIKGFSRDDAGLSAFGGLDEFYGLQFRQSGAGFEGGRAFSAFSGGGRAGASQMGFLARQMGGGGNDRTSAFRGLEAAGRAVDERQAANRANGGTAGNQSALEAILMELRRIRTQ